MPLFRYRASDDWYGAKKSKGIPFENPSGFLRFMARPYRGFKRMVHALNRRSEAPYHCSGIGQATTGAGLIITMYFVYVLKSEKDDKFYIGFTNDVKKRCRDHNNGSNKSTRDRRPLKLVYYEAHCDKDDALRRERYFKTSKGKTTIRQILRHFLEEESS